MTSHRFPCPARAVLSFAFLVTCWGTAWTQEPHSHKHDPAALHFSHPLVTESPSPDTKLRVDYFFEDLRDDQGKQHTVRLEGEYAFLPSLSVEVNVPYRFLESPEAASRHRLGTVEVAVKYANFRLATRGLLVGGGIEFGLPTGNDEAGIGSDHLLEARPFLDLGYHQGHLEVVGVTSFAVHLNDRPGDDAATELGWNLSTLYHFTSRLEALLEIDGSHGIGKPAQDAVVNLTPGFKVLPLANRNLKIGVGARIPLSVGREFGVMTILSLFWHF